MPKSKKIKLPKDAQVPDHIVVIPDGNRRWARARGLNSSEGHRMGAKRLME
ncbi:undecaprenyl diphosphate synthase family protein, partial [Candidatus Woesebacteria bacterium]|nr:undecaprenyl diphosphate synthase family protein [Candidatus Woesebacteria bacterium]